MARRLTLRDALGVLRATKDVVLDAFTRRVPDVRPIVFDQDGHDDWRAMVDAADMWRAPSSV